MLTRVNQIKLVFANFSIDHYNLLHLGGKCVCVGLFLTGGVRDMRFFEVVQAKLYFPTFGAFLRAILT